MRKHDSIHDTARDLAFRGSVFSPAPLNVNFRTLQPAVSKDQRRVSMKHILLTLLIFFISGFLSTTYSSEHSFVLDYTYRITLHDGSSHIVQVISKSENAITAKGISGWGITIELDKIEKSELLYGEIRNGRYIQYDPNASRLLFIPTARPIQHGAGSIALYEMVFPLVSFGLGNILTLSGGAPFIAFSGRDYFYFAPKITPFSSGNLDLAFGAMYMGMWEYEDDDAGILYTIGTLGSSAKALTIGLVWSYQYDVTNDRLGMDYEPEDRTSKPIAILGGELLINNAIKLLTENWIPLDGDNALTSLAVRFIGSEMSADMGFFAPTPLFSDRTGRWIPWASFVYNFGYR